tara:strand:+ start:333 stop:1172 length:840 start_codon:yes stop_codon:yes gene_type:complete
MASEADHTPSLQTDVALPSVVVEDTSVSKESYEALKRQLEQKTVDLADARARSEVYESKERTRIAAFQPAAVEFLGSLMDDADPEAKADLAPLQTWANEFHQKQDIISQAPLARLVSCASAKLKRHRDEASANGETAATLANTIKELEVAKSERDGLRQRVGELESLADERQAGLEKLSAELARAGLMTERFNFSKVSSREKDAPQSEAATPIQTSGDAGLVSSTSNASKGRSHPTDHLLADIMSRGTGRLRVMGSTTSHSLLGNSSAEGDIMAALRAH